MSMQFDNSPKLALGALPKLTPEAALKAAGSQLFEAGMKGDQAAFNAALQKIGSISGVSDAVLKNAPALMNSAARMAATAETLDVDGADRLMRQIEIVGEGLGGVEIPQDLITAHARTLEIARETAEMVADITVEAGDPLEFARNFPNLTALRTRTGGILDPEQDAQQFASAIRRSGAV